MVKDTLSQQLLRPAVAMIELIFALVIMGIVLMSAPQLISQANNSTVASSQQEAIALVASHISLILSRHWDEANANQTNKVTILQTSTDTQAANINGLEPNGLGFRNGTPVFGKHRGYLDSGGNIIAASNIGQDGAEGVNDDIDDFDDTRADLAVSGVAGNDNYMDKQMQITTAVNYIADSPTGATTTYNAGTNQLVYNFNPVDAARTTHIKYIRVTLNEGLAASGTLDKQIVLDAFSCNIGRHYMREVDNL